MARGWRTKCRGAMHGKKTHVPTANWVLPSVGARRAKMARFHFPTTPSRAGLSLAHLFCGGTFMNPALIAAARSTGSYSGRNGSMLTSTCATPLALATSDLPAASAASFSARSSCDATRAILRGGVTMDRSANLYSASGNASAMPMKPLKVLP